MTTQMTRPTRQGLVGDDDIGVRAAVACVSLALLVFGLAGLASANAALSAIGLFLYAFIGFGAALLLAFGYRGWDVVALSPPLSLAIILLVGVFLVNTGTWAVGPPLFWVLAIGSAFVHFMVLARTLVALHSRRLSLHGGPPAKRDEDGGPRRHGRYRFTVDTRPPVLLAGAATVVGFAICLGSAFAVRHLNPGMSGLLGEISPAWYVGLVLLAAAVLLGQRLVSFCTGLPVVALQLALTLTPAIVYDYPRYAWTAKHVGATSYILLHHSVNPKIDIYQAWPGLFSGVAWLCRVSDLADPMGVARWWPPVVDLATLLVIRQLSYRVLRDPRRAWLATTLFMLEYSTSDANYFSPQSAGYLLAIAVFIVVFRHREDGQRLSTGGSVLLVAMSLALASSHQLTPYLVTGVLIVLVLLSRATTRWAPVIMLAPAVAWAVLRFSYVSKYASLKELGNPLHNLLTPGAATRGPSDGTTVIVTKYVQGGGALLLVLLALAVLVRYRSRLHLTLALCAASSGTLIFANSYGNEAAYRVEVFALPWLAILAADWQPLSRLGSTVFWSLSVPVLLSVFLVADMGLDFLYAERSGDITAFRTFEQSAPAGSILIVIGYEGNFPGNVTGRYNVVHEEAYYHIAGFATDNAESASSSFKQFMTVLLTTHQLIPAPQTDSAIVNRQIYVLTAQQPAAYLAEYNYATLGQYGAFSTEFEGSSQWSVVLRTPTAKLFRLAASP